MKAPLGNQQYFGLRTKYKVRPLNSGNQSDLLIYASERSEINTVICASKSYNVIWSITRPGTFFTDFLEIQP